VVVTDISQGVCIVWSLHVHLVKG